MRKLVAVTAAMFRMQEIRAAQVSGRLGNHERAVGSDWVVSAGDHSWPVGILADKSGASVSFADGQTLRVASDWKPGMPLVEATADEAPLTFKAAPITSGYRVRHRGADINLRIRTPRQHALAAHMLEKIAPDTSKMLLCPMPGLVVALNVAQGDEIQEGQALCTVEAMKMENVLKAERSGVVKKINAQAGASLAVDDVIMEFE